MLSLLFIFLNGLCSVLMGERKKWKVVVVELSIVSMHDICDNRFKKVSKNFYNNHGCNVVSFDSCFRLDTHSLRTSDMDTIWVYILRKCLHNLQKIPRIFWLVVVIFVHRWLGFIPYLLSERSTRNFSVFSEPFWRWFSLVLLRIIVKK